MTLGGELQETRCIAVVDGAMILTEAGALVYEGVRAPRIPMPGSAYIRIVNQRLVQDRIVQVERVGEDRHGTAVARVWVDGESVNDRIAAEIAKLDL